MPRSGELGYAVVASVLHASMRPGQSFPEVVDRRAGADRQAGVLQ